MYLGSQPGPVVAVMWRPMKQDRKGESHHYVPQCYLRHWCAADDKMWIYPVDGRSPFRASPKNFAAENGLYDTSDVPHLAEIDQEGDLGKLEALYDSRWPDIFNGTVDLATKMNLSRYLALLHLRHPSNKEEVRTMNAVFRRIAEMPGSKNEIEIRGTSGERITVRKSDIQSYAGDTPENTKAGFFNTMRRSVEDLAAILNARKWGVIYAGGGEPVFVTSDHPLILQRGASTRTKFGFGTPGTVITFPISPSKMLRIADDYAADGLHYPLIELGDLNDGTVLGAGRFVFSATKM